MPLVLPALARSAARARRTVVVAVAALATTASSLAMADGIDISHWQGAVSWNKVDSAGVQFAFMKATEGSDYADPTLATNWKGAAAVGIYRGAYHFARPKVGTAAAQARYYVSQVGLARFDEPGSLPPVLDLEATGGLSPSRLRTWVSTWLTTVEDLTGRTPVLYFSPYFWIDHMGNSTAFARYPLWIAHYTTAAQPKVPGGWSSWTFWQYTSSGSVAGIAGDVDKNRFNGTSADLAALAQTTGGSTAPVAPGPSVPTAAPSTLTLSSAATEVGINEPVAFSGSLQGTSDGAAVPARPVTLWARAAGSTTWAQVGSATTDAAGAWTVTARVPRSTDYQVRFAGDTAYVPAVSDPAVRVTTPPRARPDLDLRTNRTRVRPGRAVMLYGHLTSPAGGVAHQTVRVYQRPLHGGRWRPVSRTTSLAPTGWWSITVHPRRSRVYKAVSADTLFYVGATSNRVTVRVR